MMEKITTPMDTVAKLNDGLGHALAYDNIAIVVLILALGFSGAFNIIQFFAAVRVDKNRRDDTDKLLKLAFDRVEVDNKILSTLTLIDQKVSHVKKS